MQAFWLLFALSWRWRCRVLAQDPVLPAVTAIHTAPTLGEGFRRRSRCDRAALLVTTCTCARRAFRSRCTRSVMC
ncbi:hypothetical protein LNP74_31625 [Klebsiella pneumoniae subsp. pneumoniae]|nr:hypothetical protein [Klebsiella pneumoniae subsp. pneumoniae]